MGTIFHLSCPSCGAQVSVRSATSVLVVCDYCQSMLVRQPDNRFSDNGKTSAVLEDYSLIQIGTTGRYLDRPFTVIGRLQKEYDRGSWNEWYLIFDDGQDGWLSDSCGQYAVTVLKEKAYESAPRYEETTPGGTQFRYGGQMFLAADVRSAKSLSAKAQGELPFILNKDEITYAADYRASKSFLTLDYTHCPPEHHEHIDKDAVIDFEYVKWPAKGNKDEKKPAPQRTAQVDKPKGPELYFGHSVTLEDLRCQLLRTQEQIQERAGKLRGKAEQFACPNCGAPMNWYPGIAHFVVCPSCHADVDITSGQASLFGMHSMREAQISAASIKLGEIAKIGGHSWEVIGLMRCLELEADGSTYLKETYASYMPHLEDHPMTLVQSSDWFEYLLYHPTEGFRWIVETDEGWEQVVGIDNWPSWDKTGSVRLAGKTFSKQWEYGSKVIYAAGAFTWHVRPEDTTFIADYRHKEEKLTIERTGNEITWSRSRPVSENAIAAWFHRPELAKIEKKGFDGEGKQKSLRTVAIVATALLLLVNLPAIASSGLEEYMDSMTFACILLWAPIYMRRTID